VKLGIGALAVLVLALLGSWVYARLQPTREMRLAEGTQRVIRVQVLNGSGESGIGSRVASFLREGGFHVVEVRNADRSDYFPTLVVARREDGRTALEVSRYLGGPPVLQQTWNSDLADVTVVIGSDRSRLHLEP
jgi:hypothetical protein